MKQHIDKILIIVILCIAISDEYLFQVLFDNLLSIPFFLLLYIGYHYKKNNIKHIFELIVYVLSILIILLINYFYYPQLSSLPVIMIIGLFTLLYKKINHKSVEIKNKKILQKNIDFINNINLGSGVKWVRDGWIAVDKCHEKTNDKRVLAIDVTNGGLLKYFKPNTIDSIYTSHTLEHFTFSETQQILKDCYNILKPNRLIRIVVPDLDICITKYYNKDYEWWKNNQINPKTNLIDDLEMSNYFIRSIGANNNIFNVDRNDRDTIRGAHLSVYNFSILNKLLVDTGFSVIKKLEYNECSEIFTGLDNREKCSLHIEAIK